MTKYLLVIAAGFGAGYFFGVRNGARNVAIDVVDRLREADWDKESKMILDNPCYQN